MLLALMLALKVRVPGADRGRGAGDLRSSTSRSTRGCACRCLGACCRCCTSHAAARALCPRSRKRQRSGVPARQCEQLGAMARADGPAGAEVPRARRRFVRRGKSPQWPSDRVITLRDEVALVEPLLARAGSPLALVGHSYGAAVALIAALAIPVACVRWPCTSRRCSRCSMPRSRRRTRPTVSATPWLHAAIALDAGDPDAAAERFIDYWMGLGSLGADAGTAQAGHCRFGHQRAPMGACLVHRAHAAGGIPFARCAGALHGGQALDSLGPRRGAVADGRAAARRGRGVRAARPHGPASRILTRSIRSSRNSSNDHDLVRSSLRPSRWCSTRTCCGSSWRRRCSACSSAACRD